MNFIDPFDIEFILNPVCPLHLTWMEILILVFLFQMHFECAEAIFRSRLGKFYSNSNKIHFTSLVQKSAMSDNRKHSPDGQCRVPCQLEPYWIPFAKVLELSEIPISLPFLIRSKSGDMINVGKCAGHCNSSFKSLYPNHSVRSKVSPKLPYCDIKEIQTHCVPIEFEDIETEIIGDEEIVQGPKIKNLVIRNCACTEVQTCDWKHTMPLSKW